MEAREVRTTQVEEVRNVMEKIELNKGQDDPLSTSEGQVEHAGNKTSKGNLYVCMYCMLYIWSPG